MKKKYCIFLLLFIYILSAFSITLSFSVEGKVKNENTRILSYNELKAIHERKNIKKCTPGEVYRYYKKIKDSCGQSTFV